MCPQIRSFCHSSRFNGDEVEERESRKGWWQSRVQQKAWSVGRHNLMVEWLEKARRWLDFSERKMDVRV